MLQKKIFVIVLINFISQSIVDWIPNNVIHHISLQGSLFHIIFGLKIQTITTSQVS